MLKLTRNGLIYILMDMEVKNNKMLFNLRNWITIAPLISNVCDNKCYIATQNCRICVYNKNESYHK